jgi:hypothetical protein
MDGNTRHYPNKPFIFTPAAFVQRYLFGSIGQNQAEPAGTKKIKKRILKPLFGIFFRLMYLSMKPLMTKMRL